MIWHVSYRADFGELVEEIFGKVKDLLYAIMLECLKDALHIRQQPQESSR